MVNLGLLPLFFLQLNLYLKSMENLGRLVEEKEMKVEEEIS